MQVMQRYIDNAALIAKTNQMAGGVWFKQRQQEWEKGVLQSLLTEHHGNIWHIAKAIDERRSRLYRMFRRHGLKPKDYRADPR